MGTFGNVVCAQYTVSFLTWKGCSLWAALGPGRIAVAIGHRNDEETKKPQESNIHAVFFGFIDR